MKRAKQTTLDFRSHGGPRAGAGRKPKGNKAGVPHRERARLSRHHPVHVTIRLRPGLPTLRRADAYKALRAAFRKGCARFGFRLIHYSVQSNHLHLIVEAQNKRALSRGMQGLSIRIARALNKLWRRRGKVFADRYHAHVLDTPRAVRHALAYVLNNARRHGILSRTIDAFSSGPWFRGWREKVTIRNAHKVPCPVTAARTWLLTIGWTRYRKISVFEVPGAR